MAVHRLGDAPAVSLKKLKTGETNYEGPMHTSERKH